MELTRQFKDHLILLLFMEMNFFFAPTPFTMYPFFKRASFILAMTKAVISSSLDMAKFYTIQGWGAESGSMAPTPGF